ncbi:hypothetical protein [Ciceribacter ferrooxidans]|uniref:Uncharacterized protein n=1 Tax=Ciceribacter ferrooxidans TaxID=2509717 RepID=A0A4Q2TEH3_9HYPH|nr:hypothetical protein [Ciceribacter ferrooxidans]RYC17723.1 hypothetical protein EUU22_07055 [Ciceribacter ferrooxidans]
MSTYSISFNNTAGSSGITIYQKAPKTGDQSSVAWQTKSPVESPKTQVDWTVEYTAGPSAAPGASGAALYDPNGTPQSLETGSTFVMKL